MEKQNRIKKTIIVLAVLLALGVTALAGKLIYNYINSILQTTVSVPDNLITPEEDTGGSETSSPSGNASESEGSNSSGIGTSGTVKPKPSAPAQSTGTRTYAAATINLYNKQPEDNKPFTSGNMLPGDADTQYFRVKVFYHKKATVHFHATIRPGYEKLAEVLKVRVKLLTTGAEMYDGLMRDMPANLTYQLPSPSAPDNELYYEITAYLDTSVGNDYQDKNLIADYEWCVDETFNLDNPDTGDNFNTILVTWIAVCSGGIMVLLLLRKRKEGEENG